MARVVQLKTPGGVDQLETIDVEVPAPGRGEIRVRQTAIGVNFIDIYQRTGLYPLRTQPAVPGVEAAGVVAAVGPDVTTLAPGDRVAYAGIPGAYATERLLPVARAIRLPAAVTDKLAATSLMKGLTAHMLLTRTFRVHAETTILVHAAAGGLGTLLTRWAKRIGARVIGTVGSHAKAVLARESGADHVVVGRDADFVREVLDATSGRGVDVAYDGIGGSTLRRTFACVRPFGTVASIGQAGGPIPPIDVTELGPARSLNLARPSVMAYASEPQTYRDAAAAFFQALHDGLTVSDAQSYALSDIVSAHQDLEAGRTTGSIYLIP
jgi:NADPH:quinone reductase